MEFGRRRKARFQVLRRTSLGPLLQYLPNPVVRGEIDISIPPIQDLSGDRCVALQWDALPGRGPDANGLRSASHFLRDRQAESFSKAAQTCYRTQPAISAQVRQLEQELRADLFERFGSRISLTTAAASSPATPNRCWSCGAAHRTPSRSSRRTSRRTRDRGHEATCIYILPTVFSVYRGCSPVQLQVDRSYATRVVEAVAENSADFGLTQLPVDEKRLQVVIFTRTRSARSSGRAPAGG